MTASFTRLLQPGRIGGTRSFYGHGGCARWSGEKEMVDGIDDDGTHDAQNDFFAFF